MTTEMLTCGYKGCTQILRRNKLFNDEGRCFVHGPRFIGTPVDEPSPLLRNRDHHSKAPFRMGPRRTTVYAVLGRALEPLTIKDIAARAHIEVRQARDVVSDLVRAGYVRAVGTEMVTSGWSTSIATTYEVQA